MSEELTETMPHGDMMHPVRDLIAETEPIGDELQDRLDEIGEQNLAEAGTQLDGSAPRAPTEAENNQARPPGAAFPGDDEGPSTGEGGQDLAGAGGGGR